MTQEHWVTSFMTNYNVLLCRTYRFCSSGKHFFCLAKEMTPWEMMQQWGVFSTWLQEFGAWGGSVLSHLGSYRDFVRDHEAEGQSEVF